MTDKRIKLSNIDLSWISYLNELYWEGRIQIWLSKGYVTFKLSEVEKERWKLTDRQVGKIQKVLQDSVDKIQVNSVSLKQQILELLSDCDEVRIPNFDTDKDSPIYQKLTNISPTIEMDIEREMNLFLPLIYQSDYEELEIVYMQWKRKSSWPSLKKGAELTIKLFDTNNLLFSPLEYEQYQELPEVLTPFYLLLQFYADPIPDGKKVALYRHLLLLKSEEVTHSLDFIIFSSWKQYPNEMYSLTRDWIVSQDPYLIDWLIHGVEVPGRKESIKALQFLQPILYVEDESIEWIFKHVLAQIIAASPYESLTHLETWLSDLQTSIRTEKILKQALSEIVEDKIIDKNLMDEDFPNLEETLHSIMTNWVEEGSQSQYQVSKEILNLLT
ncbi:MAG: hypothetical protein ACFFFH_05705 [Candidatus Thorarchaeota archaeon]